MEHKRYDVFLSFHGSEELALGGTVRAFVEGYLLGDEGALNKEWRSKGGRGALSVFYDDESIVDNLHEIFEGVLQTRGGGVAVFVVTEGYLHRKWCLAELLSFLSFLDERGETTDESAHVTLLCVGLEVEDILASRLVAELYPQLRDLRLHKVDVEAGVDAGELAHRIADVAVRKLRDRSHVAGATVEESYRNLTLTLAPLASHGVWQAYFPGAPGGEPLAILYKARELGLVGPMNVYKLLEMVKDESMRHGEQLLHAYGRKWHAEWTTRREWYALKNDLRGYLGTVERHLGTPGGAAAAPGPTPVLRRLHGRLPRGLGRWFVGREQDLEQIGATLGSPGSAGMVLVHGMGGMGKSTLAAAYASRHQDEYAHVLWMAVDCGPQAGSNEEKQAAALAKYDEAYALLASSLGLPHEPGKATAAMEAWLAEQLNYLLVVDGANDASVAENKLPHRMAGHVVVTTRANRARFSTDDIAWIDLNVWDDAAAAQFYFTRLDIARPWTWTTAKSLERLANVLGRLPLALEQSAAVIHGKAYGVCRLAEYVDQLEKDIIELEELLKVSIQAGDCKATVAATYRDCVRMLRGMDGGEASLDLLRVMAFMDGQAGIPRERKFLERVVTNSDQAVVRLRDMSLVRTTYDDDNVFVHSVVQALTLHDLGEQREAWRKRAGSVITAALPKGDDEHKDRKWAERVVIHALSCSFKFMDATVQVPSILQSAVGFILRLSSNILPFFTGNEVQSEWEAELLYHAGVCLSQLAMFGDEERVWRRHLDLVGDSQLEYVATLNKLADLFETQGKPDNAESALQKVLCRVERDRGASIDDRISALDRLAGLYYSHKRLTDAKKCSDTARDLEREHGPSGESFGMAWDNFWSGKIGLALSCAEIALQSYQLRNRPGSREVMNATFKIAWLNYFSRKVDVAETLLQQVLEFREKYLVSSHPEVAMVLSSLGWLYCTQGKYAEAENMFKKAVESRDNGRLDPTHRFVGLTYALYAVLLQITGRDAGTQLEKAKASKDNLLDFAQKFIKGLENGANQNDELLGRNLLGLGFFQLCVVEDTSEAEKSLDRAHTILSALNKAAEAEVAGLLLEQCRVQPAAEQRDVQSQAKRPRRTRSCN